MSASPVSMIHTISGFSSENDIIPPMPPLPPHDVDETISSTAAKDAITNLSTMDQHDDVVVPPGDSVSNRSPLVIDGYVIGGLANSSGQICHHTQAFYKALIPFSREWSHTFQLFNRKTYIHIFTVLNRLCKGKALKSLQSNIYRSTNGTR